MFRVLHLFLAVVLAFACGVPQAYSAEPATIADSASLVGKEAPAFSLKDSNGKTHALKDYKDKLIVLEWVNFDCPFVKKHYSSKNMQSLQKKYTGKGVIWLSINSSSSGKQGNYPGDKINEMIKERGATPTAYLIDEDGSVGRNYGAKTTPHMFIIDPKGVLVYAGAIDDKPSTDAEDVKGAKNYVSQVLDGSIKGKKNKIASNKSYGCSVKY